MEEREDVALGRGGRLAVVLLLLGGGRDVDGRSSLGNLVGSGLGLRSGSDRLNLLTLLSGGLLLLGCTKTGEERLEVLLGLGAGFLGLGLLFGGLGPSDSFGGRRVDYSRQSVSTNTEIRIKVQTHYQGQGQRRPRRRRAWRPPQLQPPPSSPRPSPSCSGKER